MRRLLRIAAMGISVVGIFASPLFAQREEPSFKQIPVQLEPQEKADRTTLTPKQNGTGVAGNHRLILMDGSWQNVRKYEIAGERVRYISVERNGEWEELPADIVDWKATEKWEKEHAANTAANTGDRSPAMVEAAGIDKEAAAQRAELEARSPEVAKGLNLPDQDGVFALDVWKDEQELVELEPVDADVNSSKRGGVKVLNPLSGRRAQMELEGATAKVHLHTNEPVLYVSTDIAIDGRGNAAEDAMTVDTYGAKEAVNRKHGAQSAKSQFAIVKLDERKAVRFVGAVKIGPNGKVSEQSNVVPSEAVEMQGKHWMKIVLRQKLAVGEYALVEILSESEIAATVWDFRVDPSMEENRGAYGPLHATDAR